MRKGYRIISIEANDIYKQEQVNGATVGYTLPKKKSNKYFRLFKIFLDNSLDLLEMEKVYERICRKKFSFTDEHENDYTLAVINLKFTYTYKPQEGKSIKVKDLREHFYKHGFYLGGVHYVRYKRSSGSSRQGKCLFIDEKLQKYMTRWSECGLDAQSKDLASWEAYKSLSLSSLKGIIKIPLDGILFINDCKSEFVEDVVCVEELGGDLVASTKATTIQNDIWDGESLLDESLFEGEYADKHMLLLRNKFFKSCGFKTRLQKWFKDKNITLEGLKERGAITLATDIRQIVMVTTPNSMKFLKFMSGELTQNNVQRWFDKIDDTFGVVKFDKRTKFFGGRMVQSSYQLINTLALNEEEVERLLRQSKEYIATIRSDYDFMRYHFTDACKRESEDGVAELCDGLAERSDVIFRLMQINYDFKDTKLYYNFRNDVVNDQKKRLKQGHILLPGTNATLFGNGPEMLLALSGEFDFRSKKNKPSVLGLGEIACKKFSHGEKLVCARSPHITMGNIFCAINNLSNSIWGYFDLGENIVCVNAIGENIQQRLNGCDYDSDAMLITNDRLIVQTALKQKDLFKVPVCSINPDGSKSPTLWELDHDTSENQIGTIVNLSQKLNSLLWDKLNRGESLEIISKIYEDVCKLAVLSGIEIDKAKRAYDKISVSNEISKIAKAHSAPAPNFFREIDFVNSDRKTPLAKKREYKFYKSPMEYVYESSKAIAHRKGKDKSKEYRAISDILKSPKPQSVSTVYDRKRKVISICKEYKERLDFLYRELRFVDDDEKDIVYTTIRQVKDERNEKVKNALTEEYVLYLVLKDYEKQDCENWHLYAPLLECELFKSMLAKSKEQMQTVVYKADGEYDLYGLKFTKDK